MECRPRSTTDRANGEEGGLNYCGFCVKIRGRKLPVPYRLTPHGVPTGPIRRIGDTLVKKYFVRREWICQWWIAAAQAIFTEEASIAVLFDAGRLTPTFAPHSTICTASAAAGLTADRSTRWLQTPPVPTDAFLNLPSAECFSDPTNRRPAAFSNAIRSRYGVVLRSVRFVLAKDSLCRLGGALPDVQTI